MITETSLLKRAFLAVRKNPKPMFFTVLFDAAFFATFYMINMLIALIVPSDPAYFTKIQSDALSVIGIVILMILYIVIVLLAYSFFSMLIMGNIKSLSVKHTHDFSLFKRMFALNVFLFLTFFLIIVFLNMLFTAFVDSAAWVTAVLTLVAAIIGFGAYMFYHCTHAALILRHGLWDILKKGLHNMLTKRYFESFLFNACVMGCYLLIYIILGVVFREEILRNYTLVISIATGITIVLFYILFAFNRVYFYIIAEEHIGHAK